jgi:acyl carrier protein
MSTRMTQAEESKTIEEIEDELRELIVEGLVLKDVEPEDIKAEEPLFVEGLGLDSVDALELAMLIQKEYGIKIRGDDEENQEHFQSLRSLATFVSEELEDSET